MISDVFGEHGINFVLHSVNVVGGNRFYRYFENLWSFEIPPMRTLSCPSPEEDLFLSRKVEKRPYT